MRAVLAPGSAKSPIVEDLLDTLRGVPPRPAAA